MTDTLKTYCTFLSQKFKKRAVIGGLNESGWAKRPEGTIKTFGSVLEREATCVALGDTVRFEFDDDGLKRIRIATRYLFGKAGETWAFVKRRISEQLRRPGVPDDLCSSGIRECEWLHGTVIIRAKLYEKGKATKAYVYLERATVAGTVGPASLEDLFVYDAA